MKIIEVSSNGITLVDMYKRRAFVDFRECNENWVLYNKCKNNWSEAEELDFRSKSRCVGERDICAKPMYFQFFTKPFTKVEFSGWFAEKRFNNLRNNIIEVGWSTFDLS